MTTNRSYEEERVQSKAGKEKKKAEPGRLLTLLFHPLNKASS